MHRKDLEKTLESFKIYNYSIDDNEELHIHDSVDLSGMNLEKIPFKIHSIHSLQLKGNKIKSFENFPRKANTVVLSYNSITSFETFPEDSEVEFLVLDDNLLKEFNSFPIKVNTLSIENNPINSIEGAPMGKLYAKETGISDDVLLIHSICSLAKTWNSKISLLENVKKFIRSSPNAYKSIVYSDFFQTNFEELKMALTSSKFGI